MHAGVPHFDHRTAALHDIMPPEVRQYLQGRNWVGYNIRRSWSYSPSTNKVYPVHDGVLAFSVSRRRIVYKTSVTYLTAALPAAAINDTDFLDYRLTPFLRVEHRHTHSLTFRTETPGVLQYWQTDKVVHGSVNLVNPGHLQPEVSDLVRESVECRVILVDPKDEPAKRAT